MSDLLIVKVAVPGPFLFALDYFFDPKEALETELMPVIGGRVEVPFRNKTLFGLVMDIVHSPDHEMAKIKPLISVLDSKPLYANSDLALLEWAARYYHEPIGEVVMAALPKRLRAGEQVEINGMQYWHLTELGKEQGLDAISKRALRQQALFQHLQEQGWQSESELNQQLEKWRTSAKALTEKGVLESTFGPCLLEHELPPPPLHNLNAEQQLAVDTVVDSQEDGECFAAFLLEGVTGSGKTEVYLGMIESVLQRGKQALVLVPEIGLTPQMVGRFEATLQSRIAVLHSGLNDSERHCAWQSVRSGEINVLLGTRSAVFAPFQNLGICIIDEEHDLSYKQQEGFRYSARDLIVQRAHLQKLPVVLGSATPCFESLQNAHTGRYRHLHLKQRAANARPPSMKLLDIRGEKIQEGVSTSLRVAMQKHLEKGNQVLLFLNRRGFSPVLMCHDCGWQATCPSCDSNMTFHRSAQAHHGDDMEAGYLVCHHCGEQMEKPSGCPSCESEEFVKVGQGTERLELAIQDWFEDKTIVRIDRDTTRLKGSMAALTALVSRGDADILIGTQMLAKGHHFPNVTLVGLLDIDQGLFSADYRAAERMAQLVVQVAGRAGRAEKQGEVLIQTHHPDHPLLTTLLTHGYDAFSVKAIAERKKAMLPPFKYQIMVRAEAVNGQDAMNFLASFKAGLARFLDAWNQPECEQQSIQLWGPVSAPMLRRQGRYRYQLLIHGSHRKLMHQLINEIHPHVYKSPLTRKVRWSLDIDPQEMY